MRSLEADGVTKPKALESKPDALGWHWIWDAFNLLSTDRVNNMTVGAIPWSSMDRYARRHGISGADFEMFELILPRLDQAYLTKVREDGGKHKSNQTHGRRKRR